MRLIYFLHLFSSFTLYGSLLIKAHPIDHNDKIALKQDVCRVIVEARSETRLNELLDKLSSSDFEVSESMYQEFKSGFREHIKDSSFTFLHCYSFLGLGEKVKTLLVEKGNIDLNARDHVALTPLHIASFMGHVDIVKALLAYENIDVNAKENDGITPLHLASEMGHLEIVEYLLNHKDIDVNAKSESHFTPLHFASGMRHLDVVKALLATKNIQVNTKSKYGKPPLHLASEYGDINVVQALLCHKDIDLKVKDNQGRSALDLAKIKDSEISQKLKKETANYQYDSVINALKVKMNFPLLTHRINLTKSPLSFDNCPIIHFI